MTGAARVEMLRNHDRGRKVGRQARHDARQRLDPARRRSDHDELGFRRDRRSRHVVHALSLALWPGVHRGAGFSYSQDELPVPIFNAEASISPSPRLARFSARPMDTYRMIALTALRTTV